MEKEFIDFFVKQQIFEEMTEKNSQVHGLFITRGNLTISELSKLPPFSIGTVSTSVHYLETLLLVHKNDSKYGYCMYSYGVAWLNYREYYYQPMRIWQNEFSQVKLDLEENLNDYHFNPQIGSFSDLFD
jgi:DNA-binding transcriptional regulator GbsR (MarR family)